MRLATSILALLLCSAAAHATENAKISLPLDGYYRTGRYTAIAIDAPPAQQLNIDADGILPLRIAAAGQRVSGVFPLLILSTPGERLRVNVDGAITETPVTWRALNENDRLVGMINSPDQAIAQRLFPGKNL